MRAQVAHQAGSPLYGMLVHCRVTPSIKFINTHLYTWVERGTVGVKCIAHEHNKMSSASAQTWTTRATAEHTAPYSISVGPFLSIPLLEVSIHTGLTVLSSLCTTRRCGSKIQYFWDHGTYMINIKLLGILSRLCSFALFNDHLFNKLLVGGPLKYK